MAGSGARLAVYNPATAQVIAELQSAQAVDVDAAVRAARATFISGVWSGAAVAERQRVLYRCAEQLRAELEAIAQLETLCAGITLAGSARRQIGAAATWLQYFAERIGSRAGLLFDQTPGAVTMVTHEPRGVAGLFSPWNVPVGLSMIKIAAAIAAGNSVVIKPSEQTPLAVLAAVRSLEAAGLPPGVVNVVNGAGVQTGAALASHPDLDCISFTGGGVAGRSVAQAAGANLVPCILELGGKSAFVVFADADMDRALDAALLSIFGNNGQACLAGSRILLQAEIADEFTQRFVARTQQIRVGDPFDPATELGPLASEAHLNRVLGYVDVARAEGDEVLTGGTRRTDLGPGYYMAPVVARCADPAHRIAREEIFGPFATLLTFNDEEHAFHLANQTEYGLVAYLWSNDHARVLRGHRALRAGTVLVNSAMVRELNAPFGGVANSGVGSEGGDYSLRFYTQEKTVVLSEAWRAGVQMGQQSENSD